MPAAVSDPGRPLLGTPLDSAWSDPLPSARLVEVSHACIEPGLPLPFTPISFPQIVRLDRTMEQIVFPVPSICEFLTQESKLRIYYTTERDEQGSKINDFFLRSEDLFNEMNWQKKLRGEGSGSWVPVVRNVSPSLGLLWLH